MRISKFKVRVIATFTCINVMALIFWLGMSRSRRWVIQESLTTGVERQELILASAKALRFVTTNLPDLSSKSHKDSQIVTRSPDLAAVKIPNIFRPERAIELISQNANGSSILQKRHDIKIKSTTNPLMRNCSDILTGMTHGRWIERKLTTMEQAKVDRYLKDERGAYHIPSTFQRGDGLCGDVPYEKSPLYRHMWFKAICNPKGSTPCCMRNKCVSSTVEECQCAGCYDERPAIHAEFAEWRTKRADCKPHNYSTAEACRVLQGSTISFVGDSFIRHIFAALIILLTGNTVDGALKPDIRQYQREKCTGWHQVTGLTCRKLLVEKRSLCDGTVRVDYTEVFPAKHLPSSIPVLHSHSLKASKSLIVLGLGIHNDFRVDDVKNIFLKPFLNIHQFWRSQPQDIATVIAEMKSFKTEVNVENNFMHDLFLNKNNYLGVLNEKYNNKNRYSRSNSKNNINILNEYHKFINFSFDASDILKIEKKLNLTLSKVIHSNNATLHQSVTPISSQVQIPKLDLQNPNPSSSKTSTSTIISHSNLLWLGIHAPGVLKSPKFPRQTHAGVLSYNREVYKVLERWGVPYLDTYSFSNGTVSFDGTHYGWGINMLKVNMILTYIERKLKHEL